MKNQLFFIAFLLLLFSNCSSQSKVGKTGEAVFTAPIGVQAYSFRNYFPKDVPGTLDRIQAMGITEIEGGGGRIAPEDYKKMCDQRGISIPSTGASFEDLKNDPMKVVNTAKALGSKFVMCAWVPHENRGNFSIDDANRAIKVFNSAGKVLADNGLTFCYHPHGYEFQSYQDGTLMDYIIQSTDPKHVNYEMDVFWAYFGGADPVALLKKYPKRWKLLHLKDIKNGTKRDMTGGTDVENNVVIGTGEIDFAGIMKTAREIGVAHYFIEDESSSVVNQVPKSIAYLRSLKY